MTDLTACFIASDLFAVEMHGNVYVRGEPVDGRCNLTVNRERLLAMRDAIDKALSGWAPVVRMFNPEDLV